MHDLTKLLLDILRDKDEASTTKKISQFSKQFRDTVEQARGEGAKTLSLSRNKVKRITKLENTGEQYVYDVSMSHPEHRWFFGNNCLLHNTDSTYFSAWPAFKKEVEAGTLKWDKDTVVELYDAIAEQVSDTFPDFLYNTYNVPLSKSQGVIASGREIVAVSSLFIKKKRYAALVYDSEGKRVDVGGKPGKVKAMGLDLRRSDTPKFVQNFLMDVLIATLTGQGEDHVLNMIVEFKENFRALKPWQMGTPKAVNNLTKYRERKELWLLQKAQGEKSTLTVPGHVSASMNWNELRDIKGDRTSMPILDGQKVVVCKLKENNAMTHYTSIAYPVDESRLPEWFTSLPFDEDAMEAAIVSQKLENLLGVLNWRLADTTKQAGHFNSLFGW